MRHGIGGLGRLGLLVVSVAAMAGCHNDPEAAEPDSVPDGARKIMEKPSYAPARWLFYVADRDSGEVLLSQRPDEMVFTGSTAKLFTIGTVYDTIGPDTRLTTPVYATAPTVDSLLRGNVILVGSGDLALGGRGAMRGRVDHAFTATSIDHVYGDVAPIARKVDDDPLAGLDDLARQVAAKGVKTIDGDVIIDTRLWETYEGQEAPVPPVFVNDNILDIEVSPGAVGQPGTVRATPNTAAFTVQSKVTTVASSTPSDLDVAVDPANPRNLVVSGSIPDGKPQLTIYRVPDASTWVRTLFIEALTRAGITVTAPAVGANDEAGLPPASSYSADRQLASLRSPPLQAFGSMIMQTSYNTGANAMLCLLAVKAGSTDCTTGLKTIRDTIDKAGLVSDDVVLVDGAGRDPASTTPTQMTAWVRWAAAQPWGPVFESGQSVLGEKGQLASSGASSPAKGKVAAKGGTSVAVDPATGRALFNVESLAGYMTTDQGRRLVFGLSMSGGTFPNLLTGLYEASDDVAMVAAAFQQSLSK